MTTIRQLREALATIEEEWDDVGVFPIVDGKYSPAMQVNLATSDTHDRHPAVLYLECGPFGPDDELPLTPKPSLQAWRR